MPINKNNKIRPQNIRNSNQVTSLKNGLNKEKKGNPKEKNKKETNPVRKEEILNED